jgi:hypothetical protein
MFDYSHPEYADHYLAALFLEGEYGSDCPHDPGNADRFSSWGCNCQIKEEQVAAKWFSS